MYVFKPNFFEFQMSTLLNTCLGFVQTVKKKYSDICRIILLNANKRILGTC